MPSFIFSIDGASFGTSESLIIHDEVGTEADSITAVIGDPTGLLPWVSAEDAKCSAAVGFLDSGMSNFGSYELNNVVYDYVACVFTFTGHSVSFSKEVKSKKTRTHEKITLEDLVAKMAGEMGLKPRVSDELKSMFFEAVSQTNETNLNFLVRLAKDYGAVVKVGNDHLIFIERGKGKNASGDDLPTVIITPLDLLEGSKCTARERMRYKAAEAKWFDVKKAALVTEKVGDGEPVLSLKKTFPDQQSAKAAAQAELNNKKRELYVLDLVVEGNGNIIAETPITTVGLKVPEGNQWIVQSVDHTVNGGGFITRFTAEQKV